jgi:hypothetical protein
MNFPSLKLPKMINQKRHEFFEFRQLQHLLEILFYCTSDFGVKKSWGWRCFGGLEVLRPKRAKPGQLLPLYNFASSDTSPTVKQDI